MRQTKRFPRLRVVSLVTVALLGGVVTPGLAQEDDGAAKDERRTNYLSLTQLDAYLEFRSEFDQSRVRSDPSDPALARRSQTNRDWLFEERLGLTFGGSVIDPKFISFAGDFGLALTQNRFSEHTSTYDDVDRDEGRLLTYNLRANFFPAAKHRATVRALRQEDRISRRFQPTLRERRTELGTSWTFAHDKIPMEFSYNYRETDRTGNRRDEDDEHFTQRTLHWGLDYLIAEGHKIEFSYEHVEDDREYQGLNQSFETTRDLFRLDHELRFGSTKQHRYETIMKWQEESGDFARDILQIGPQLALDHGDSLQTSYKYQFNQEQYEGIDVDQHRASFQLTHKLYANLRTTVDLFGLHEKIESDVSTTQYGGSVDWQYNRPNRFGKFLANLALAHDTQEVSSGGNGTRLVLREPAVFTDPIDVTIANRNVVPGSVLVTDATGRRIYTPGIDYTELRTGEVTRLRRIDIGRIDDGDTVLITYRYNTPADGQIDTVRVDFSLEQRFDNGLTPYYRFSLRDQDVNTSRGFALGADRTDHHRLGLRYQQKRYSLHGEFEIYDDTIDPYDAFHVDGIYHVIQKPRRTMDASARLSRFFFDGDLDTRDVTLLDLSLNHRWHISRSVTAIQRLAFRWEDDSIGGITQGWDVTAGLTYRVGELFAEMTVEYDRLRLPGSTEDGFGAFVRVRREIPNLFGVR